MDRKIKVWVKAEVAENREIKLSKVLEFKNGTVEIPINKDGSVKWFDDSKLLINDLDHTGKEEEQEHEKVCC